jgi:predicted DNA-binding transcriptional regulator AlpA
MQIDPPTPALQNTGAANLDKLADLVVSKLAGRLSADPERLLNLRELAERLGFSERTVTGFIARGELPEGHLIGDSRRWNWREVQPFLAGRKGRKKRRGRGIHKKAKLRTTEAGLPAPSLN